MSKAPCVFFAMGSCRKGDSCTFDHSGTTRPSLGSQRKDFRYSQSGTRNGYKYSSSLPEDDFNCGNGKVDERVSDGADGPTLSIQTSIATSPSLSSSPGPMLDKSSLPQMSSQTDAVGLGTSTAVTRDIQNLQLSSKEPAHLQNSTFEGKISLSHGNSANLPTLHGPKDVQSTGIASENQAHLPTRPSLNSIGVCRQHHLQELPHTLLPDKQAPLPHWSEYSDPAADLNVPFCKYFAQGRCIEGNNCRYRHSLSVMEHYILFRDTQPRPWIYNVGFNHTQIPAPIFPNICKFYPLGNCRNGDTCTFTHIASNNIRSSSLISKKGELLRYSHNPTDTRSVQVFSTPCKNFPEKGFCLDGDACFYDHNAHTSVPSQFGNSSPQDVPWQDRSNDQGRNIRTPLVPCMRFREGNFRKDNFSFLYDEKMESEKSQGFSPPEERTSNEASNHPQKDAESAITTITCHPENCNEFENSHQFPCRWYRMGTCHKGKLCKFLHEQVINQNGNDGDEAAANEWCIESKLESWTTRSLGENGKDCEFLSEKMEGSRGESSECFAEWNNYNRVDSDSGWYLPGVSFERNLCHSLNHRTGFGYLKSAVEITKETKTSCAHEIAPPGDLSLDPAAVTWVGEWPEADNEPSDDTATAAAANSLSRDPAAETWIGRWLDSTHDSSGVNLNDVDANHVANVMINQREVDDGFKSRAANEPLINSFQEATLKETSAGFRRERPFFNCLVNFEPGNGCHPSHIFTASDAHRVSVSNLPPSVTYEELRVLSEAIVPIEYMDIEYAGKFTKAVIELKEPFHSSLIATQLDGQTFGGRILVARMHTIAPESVLDPLHSNAVKITWPSPTRFAWVYYRTVTMAKQEATRLNGQTFKGRQVTATFQRPKPKQTDSFTVRLTDLPKDITHESLREYCSGCSLLTLGDPTYSEDPLGNIHDLIRVSSLGYPYVFISLPESYVNTKQIAFARVGANLSDVMKLHGVPQPFLGQRSLTLQPVFHMSFKLSGCRFEAIRDDFERLQEAQKNHCEFYVFDEDNFISIHICSGESDPQFFGLANKELQSILQGEIFRIDGEAIWDDYFDLMSSVNAVGKINAQANKSFLIEVDNRTKVVRVVGNSIGQKRARTAVSRLLKNVVEQRYVLPIHSVLSLRRLLDGGFKTLQDKLGVNKVTLDVTVPQLVARGDEEVLRAAQSTLDASQSSKEDDVCVTLSTPTCSLCHRVPNESCLLPCDHMYCRACLQQVLIASVGPQNVPPQCIATRIEVGNYSEANSKCAGYIPYTIIRDSLSAHQEIMFLQSTFLAHVRDHSDEFFFCPSSNCETVYRRGFRSAVYRCPLCSTEVCTSCGSEYHLGIPCLTSSNDL